MKKVLLLSASILAISGCGTRADWHNDCVRNYSETGRTYAQCKERVKNDRLARKRTPEEGPPQATGSDREVPEGMVSVDPQGTEIESFKEQSKRIRGTVDVPEEEK